MLARVKKLRAEHGREGEPFEVHAISLDAFSVDGVRRLEDRGVTDAIVGFRWPYTTEPDTQPLAEKLDLLRRFADKVIAATYRDGVTRRGQPTSVVFGCTGSSMGGSGAGRSRTPCSGRRARAASRARGPRVGTAVGRGIEALPTEEAVLDELQVGVEAQRLVVDHALLRVRTDEEARHAEAVTVLVDDSAVRHGRRSRPSRPTPGRSRSNPSPGRSSPC